MIAPSQPQTRIALTMTEVGLSVAGIIAAITPLLLWASWSEFVFYLVLSVGCGAFPVFVGLAHVRGRLMGEARSDRDILGLKGVRQRIADWDKLQEHDKGVRRKQFEIKGDARREFGFMMRVTIGLILAVAVVFLAVYLGFEVTYG
ncbi:MAG: hypothetical protein QGG19_22465 [Alphaproteobacteria bacterium]|nr:hypothetical protein [Rhodospirillaceae bacterium]MDP6024020.1 hypothetical protein [Alphaproteobacteria bacterium]MDP6254323.1 hypothetical protein [Alphaproteobacteria bacterium]MDP7054919.1 hypothetical protein [Alphaproteobacteria bacterium]MDP7227801.1 hypothetical protein [Alphaproteobacteria bacterium]